MKKKIAPLLAVVLMLVLGGCGETPPAEGNGGFDGPLEALVERIYEEKDPGIGVGEIEIDLADAEAVQMFTGLSDASAVEEVAVSEALIGSQAYSLVLVRVADVKDARSVAEAMRDGIDPWKWICVGADDVQVVASGDVVMLIMVSSELSDSVTSKEIVEAFETVTGGALDIAL